MAEIKAKIEMVIEVPSPPYSLRYFNNGLDDTGISLGELSDETLRQVGEAYTNELLAMAKVQRQKTGKEPTAIPVPATSEPIADPAKAGVPDPEPMDKAAPVTQTTLEGYWYCAECNLNNEIGKRCSECNARDPDWKKRKK